MTISSIISIEANANRFSITRYCIIALAFYVYPDDADGFGDAVNRFFAPHS